MKKIISIVGARPQFVKASVVSNKLRDKGINEILIHTGQHYDVNMSDVFFQELAIPEPEYYLGTGSGNHGEMTGKMLIEIEKVLLKEKPDMVVVYGDTNTTLAGALASSKLHIPLTHIESGLRSYNKEMPEEINRVLTDHMSTMLFCPTDTAVNNLKMEGLISNEKAMPVIENVGDVMFDVALTVKKNHLSDEKEILGKYNLEENNYVLVTIHRADNTDKKENLVNIWESLIEISKDIMVFFPVHPRTKNYLEKYNLINEKKPDSLILYEPVSYIDMIVLESNARLVLTDSGGVQKESYFFKKPAVIPRNETEWVELVDAGWNVLTGADKDIIIEKTKSLLFEPIKKDWVPFYGDGEASVKIVTEMIQFIGL